MVEKMMTKKTAVYGRRSVAEAKSEKRTGKAVHSIDLQIAHARKLCEERDWDFLEPKLRTNKRGFREGSYIDDGLKGGIANRKALMALMKDIGKGKPIERIYVYATDRLTRNSFLMHAILEYLRAKDVKVFFGNLPSQGDNPGMLIGILAAIDEYQLFEIKRKSLAGIEAAAAEGKILGRPVAGLQRDETKTTWVLSDLGKQTMELRQTHSIKETAKAMKISKRRVKLMEQNIQAWQASKLNEVLKVKAVIREVQLERWRKKMKKEAREFKLWLVKNT